MHQILMNKIKIRFQKSSIPLKSLKSSKIYLLTEFYESDWSYPNGGFWFLGYAVSNNYYAGRIGK